jgi:hypothetical protein
MAKKKQKRPDYALRKKWIAALESGKYKQTRGQLRCTSGKRQSYCCLGVLCDIVNPDGWVDDSLRCETDENDLSSAQLPPFINRRIGLSGDGESQLIQLNDEKKFTFKKIAAVLKDPKFWRTP